MNIFANFIGNNYALTSGDIGEALSRSASTLKSYGVSLSDSMALVTGAQESIQDSSKVGQALKSLAINLGGIKTNAKSGEIELNKTAKALDKYAGINVVKQNGELMNTMEILTKLSGKWDDLSQVQKAGLGEAIAGKYQSNVFNALMDNFEKVKTIQSEIANGDALGSASKENARFVDSIQGRVVKLQEELKRLVTTTISSDMTKGLVSGFTGVVSTINNVIGVFDKLGASTPVVASGLAGIFMTIKSLATGKGITNFGSILKDLTPLGGSIKKIQSDLRGTSSQFSTISSGATKYSGAMRVASSSSESFSSTLRKNSVVATKTGDSWKVMTKSASQAKTKLSGLGSALSGIGSTLVSTLANTALMAGVGIAISLATQAWYNYAHASEIAMEKHEENITKINTKMSELKNEKSSLQSIAKEYDTLSKKTNKSAEELERYNELRNQIAEIAPDLVVGTDEDNNAILSLNGSLKDYIKSLDSAINRQKTLLMQQQNAEAKDASDYLQKNENRESYKKYQQPSVTAKVETEKIKSSGEELTNAINRFSMTSENAFVNSVQRIQKARENHVEQIEQSYNRVVEEQEKVNEYSSKLKQKALNKVETNSDMQKSSDDIKAFAKNITDSLDFSSLKSGEIDTYARNLSKSLKDGNIDNVLQKYKNLREELNRTGDTFEYQKGIELLIPEMSSLLGLNEDMVASMMKLDPTFTQATSSLDAYLQSFGKRESMRGFDTETDNLIKQYESFSTMLDDLGNLDAQKVNGKIQFDVEAVSEIVNKEDVPKQVKDLFTEMQSDGKISDQEMEIMMQISAGMTSDNPEQRTELLNQAQQIIDYLFPDSKIDVGELDVEAEYQLNEDSKKALSEQIGQMGDEKFIATIETHIENFEQAKDFEQLMGSLQGDKSNIQSFISAKINDLSGLESYEEMIEWILEHPEIASKYDISVVGADSVDAVSKKLDGLDLTKEEKKKIMVEVQNGNIGGLKDAINSLPEEKRTKILSDITQALSGIDTVEAKTLRDKITDLIAYDKATGKIVAVDERKLKNKKTVLNAIDKASSIIQSVLSALDSLPLTKTIKIITKRITENAKSIANNNNPWKNFSVSQFSNISDTPQEVESLSLNKSIAPVQSMATDSATPDSYSSSGEVSTMAKTDPIDTVYINPTKATTIIASYNNVWNSIKNGINLFQELENRIKKVSNNVDLLNAKMEKASSSQKITYLQQQNKLYKEQATLTNTLYKSLMEQRTQLEKKAKTYGFTINSQGNMTTYEGTLLKLSREAEKAEKKASDYKGKNEKTKTSLEKSAEKAKKKLEEAKSVSDAFLNLQNTEIPNARVEWQKLQNTIKETNDEIEQLKFEQQMYKEKNAIDKLNTSYSQYQSYIDKASHRADRSQGQQKIDYLIKQNEYMKEQIELSKKLKSQYDSERLQYKNKLKSYGANFDDVGQLTNQDSLLNKYQNSADLDKIKNWVKEYNDLNETERDITTKLEGLYNNIQDLNNEINKLKLEEKLSPFVTSLDIINSKIKKLQNNLDIIGIKMENAYGSDKLNLIKEQIALYEQLQKEQQNVLENAKNQEKILKDELEKNGFNFDSNGNINNLEDAMAGLKDSGAYEYLKSVLEQWKKLHEDEIPDAIKDIANFDKAIKDAYNEQLNITKEIEGKISDMIKKQIEDRKSAIQKETETVKTELEKQKKAYQDMRAEVDYNKDYDEKSQNVTDLERKLEIAKKDSSLGNKKKIADLEKELADAKKDLDDFVQNKIDDDIIKGYDNEIDAIEDKNNKAIEQLEEMWTDSKIAEAIQKALSTGLFEGIDGQVSNLQDAMLDFATTSGDALGVMGDSIKNNLIANLNIALDTLKNYSDIANNLGFNNIDPTSSNNRVASKSVNTGDISVNINIPNKPNISEQDIANAVKKAINDALSGTVEGL